MSFIQSLEVENLSDVAVEDMFPTRRKTSRQYEKQLAEAAKIVGEVFSGQRNPQDFRRLKERTDMMVQESPINTASFAHILGDIIDRQFYGLYENWTFDWEGLSKRITVSNFNPVKRSGILGMNRTMEWVNEGEVYPADTAYDEAYTFSVGKYGMTFGCSWEADINDIYDAIGTLPNELVRNTRTFESEWFMRQLFSAYDSGSSGSTTAFGESDRSIISHQETAPAGSQYQPPNGSETNRVKKNSQICEGALLQAFDQVRQYTSTDGRRLCPSGTTYTLIVHPKWENAVRLWMGSNQVRRSIGNWEYINSGIVDNRFNLLVSDFYPTNANPYKDHDGNDIGTTSNPADDFWFLVPTTSMMPIPSIVHGRLAGYETPMLFMRQPDAVSVGGGGREMYSFDNELAEYKVRGVLGGTMPLARAIIASTGTDTAGESP